MGDRVDRMAASEIRSCGRTGAADAAKVVVCGVLTADLLPLKTAAPRTSYFSAIVSFRAKSRNLSLFL